MTLLSAFIVLSTSPIPFSPPARTRVSNALKADRGWMILFDGKTTRGWRGFRRRVFPRDIWRIEDGALHRIKATNDSKRDIITTRQFRDFELELEWKISAGGNSGVKYLVTEKRPSSWEKASADYQRGALQRRKAPAEEIAKETPERYRYFPIAFEFQIIDDALNSDARSGRNRVTGALYDLLAPSARLIAPAGSFNRGRIVVRRGHVEHWVNGVKALEFDIGSQDLQRRINASKFGQLPGFGTIRTGRIALQDHGDEVWFRNIRLRELKP